MCYMHTYNNFPFKKLLHFYSPSLCSNNFYNYPNYFFLHQCLLNIQKLGGTKKNVIHDDLVYRYGNNFVIAVFAAGKTFLLVGINILHAFSIPKYHILKYIYEHSYMLLYFHLRYF